MKSLCIEPSIQSKRPFLDRVRVPYISLHWLLMNLLTKGQERRTVGPLLLITQRNRTTVKRTSITTTKENNDSIYNPLTDFSLCFLDRWPKEWFPPSGFKTYKEPTNEVGSVRVWPGFVTGLDFSSLSQQSSPSIFRLQWLLMNLIRVKVD